MSNIVEFVNQQREYFTPVIADNSVKWEKEAQFAIQAFQKDDFLAKMALSNPSSAQNAIINVAAIGITLNPAAKLAYLVPRDGGVCLDISYMGLMHLAMQTGSIMWGQCKLVHEHDTYEALGLDKAPVHKYNAFKDRGDVVGGYCTVKTRDGDYLTEEMSIEEIAKVQKTSKAKNGPWVNFWDEMARKTIVKRASKYWPKVDRLDSAINYLNESGGEGIEHEPILAHYDESELNEIKANEQAAFNEEISELCDKMALTEKPDELKQLFALAYRKTKGNPLQKNVQEIYNERKGQLNV